MSWKSTIRSINAEIRRAEKRQIQYAREQQADQARELVDRQNEFLESIKSIHRVFTTKTDWQRFITATEPERPTHSALREKKAIYAYENYTPFFYY